MYTIDRAPIHFKFKTLFAATFWRMARAHALFRIKRSELARSSICVAVFFPFFTICAVTRTRHNISAILSDLF